jgi:geranylgeranyl pyrophosphate synthase
MLDFDQALELTLKRHALHPGILAALDYAVRPPGKLFRPKLLEALARDAGVSHTQDILTLGCALEIHHAYTLVHDDMPCMDNDLTRRGKPATHVAFGEWKALLTGDALLIASLAELERLKTPQAALIRRLFHWSTGAKGLILGQWIDLGLEAARSPELLMRMHELKTARLMQIAAIGARALKGTLTLAELKAQLRFGSSTGLAFQLLDDLDDLCVAELSPHESAVNPFVLAPQAARERLARATREIQQFTGAHAKAFLASFLKVSSQKVIAQQEQWGAHVTSERTEIVKLLTSGIYS